MWFAGNYQSKLLEAIDADQLPVSYGGTQTDPDGNPKCATKVNSWLSGSVSEYVSRWVSKCKTEEF